jgi:pSer/pThr/pTyr-binding forkhead associated (FHA) protein
VALRFRILPTEETRPAGAGLARHGPSAAYALSLPEGLDAVRLGRRGDVEVPLPFAVLSGVHARVSRSEPDAGWVVEDTGSTNGTWLDGVRLAPGERRALAPGAELRLATVRVRFEGEGPAAPGSEGTATVARRLVDDLFGDAAGAPTVRVLRGAPPASLTLAVPGRAYVAGRAEGCSLCLPVEEVSREHAAFVRGAEGVVVRDLGSKNGVVVGGVRVVGERPLADGDVATIGPVTLTLDDPAARYLRELEQLPAEAAESAPPPIAAKAFGPETPSVAAPSAVAPAATSAPAPPMSGPRRARIGGAQIIVGVAVSVLVLLAVAAGVLVFARS